MASPCSAACAPAVPMLRSEASTPTTWNPSRVMGSESRPPPQPMSSSRSPSNGRRAFGSRANRCSAWSRMKASLVGLNLCRGANLPFGSHHSAAIRENRSTSAGSMEDLAVGLMTSAYQHDFDAEVQFRPGAVGGQHRQTLAAGQGQAGAVAERQTTMPGGLPKKSNLESQSQIKRHNPAGQFVDRRANVDVRYAIVDELLDDFGNIYGRKD